MTIVKPGSLLVKTAVPEKDLHLLRPGLKSAILPTGFPALRLPGKLGKWSSVPTAAGQFAAEFRVQACDAAAAVLPGMTCKVRMVPYAKKKAILVPASAVFPDEAEASASVVFLFRKDGAPEMRKVTLGKPDDKRVEILEGLREGDEVLLEKPRGKP
jgi:multidrug efflux pump subunit AcrA (membrane-fusion protein)